MFAWLVLFVWGFSSYFFTFVHGVFLCFFFHFCVTRERVRKGIKQETAAFISAKPLHLQFNVPFCFLTNKKKQKGERGKITRDTLEMLCAFYYNCAKQKEMSNILSL